MSLKNRKSCCVERDGSQSIISLWATEIPKLLQRSSSVSNSSQWILKEQPDAERLSRKTRTSSFMYMKSFLLTLKYKSAKTIKM